MENIIIEERLSKQIAYDIKYAHGVRDRFQIQTGLLYFESKYNLYAITMTKYVLNVHEFQNVTFK